MKELKYYHINNSIQIKLMNRETFAKKPEKKYDNASRQITINLRVQSQNYQYQNHEIIDFQAPNLNTPQKEDFIQQNMDIFKAQQRSQHYSFSQYDKQKFERGDSLYQINSNKCSRITFTENISNFIDSQSSQKSDLSFRSDIVEVQKKQNSDSTQKITKTTFKYESNLTTHEIKIFEKDNQFKPIFVKIVSEGIDQIFAKKLNTIDKQKQNQKFDKFFLVLKNININHPFEESVKVDFKGLQTLEGIMDKWLFEYSKYQKLIFSFDFMFSHIIYIVLMIFYWMQLEHNIQNPLISESQMKIINRNKIYCQQNILNSLRCYISFRSRQMICNPIIQKLLLQFDRHLTTNFLKMNNLETIRQLCNAFIYELSYGCGKESILKETFYLGKDFNDAHLDQIFQKYENKDKFIEQNLEEQVVLFCEIDKRNFVCTPLNRYYQTGTQINTNKILAKKHTYLSCWLLNLVLKRSKTSMSTGIKYCFRFYQLAKMLHKCKNLQRTVFFMNILFNIKSNMKVLWNKFNDTLLKSNRQNASDVLSKIRNQIEKTPFIVLGKIENNKQITIFEESWIYKIVNEIKSKNQSKQLININFHQQIQEFAKKILSYRKALQIQLLKKQEIQQNQQNKTIKMNLNYRFLNYYIYEILKKENADEVEMFNHWKTEAKKFQNSFQSFISALF